MPSINIENAKINTASIEIKTLTVSNRQLTMGTFRQIPHEYLIDLENFKLNGVPWGNVNYFWGDNGDEDNYFHIIWQKGKELKRSIILRNVENFGFIVSLRGDLREINYELSKINSTDPSYYDSLEYVKKNILHYKNCINSYEPKRMHSLDIYEEELKKSEEKFNKLEMKKSDYLLKKNEILAKLDECRKKLSSILIDLNDLPQLFIAT